MPSFGGLSNGLPRKGGGAAIGQAEPPDAAQLTIQARSTANSDDYAAVEVDTVLIGAIPCLLQDDAAALRSLE